MAPDELKDAILALNLKGESNVIFYDHRVIHTSQLEELATGFSDAQFGAVFIGVNVPRGKTLRGCIIRRNPVIAKLIWAWGQLTGANKARWIDEQIKGKP